MAYFIPKQCEKIDALVRKATKNPAYILALRHCNERTVSRVDEIRELLSLQPHLVEAYIRDHEKTKLKTAHTIAVHESKHALDAWRFLRSIPDLRNNLSQHVLCAAGAFLDPQINDPGSYRVRRVSVNSSYFEACSPITVPDKMGELYEEMKDDRYHPVEAAAYAHATIAAVQPITNGNKRLGRLVQNAIFEQYQMPVANINPAEYKAYIELLSLASKGTRAWTRKHEPNQDLLHPYMRYVSEKVIDALVNGNLKSAKR